MSDTDDANDKSNDIEAPEIRLLRDEHGAPLASWVNAPGPGVEARPAELRAWAKALRAAADVLEGKRVDRSRSRGAIGMTAEQCRAARKLAGLTPVQLAFESHMSADTVKRFEAGRTTPQRDTIDALRSALECHGVLVTPEGARWAAEPWKPDPEALGQSACTSDVRPNREE